ncbi:hypothetical protein ABGB19_18775 [Mycobacterium sp. B14F4]|uniref:hypothetical protein n=1 Tax=Mycobacterium sp. B14F4 TaxID=3153565 RepID=UPI00325D4DA6
MSQSCEPFATDALEEVAYDEVTTHNLVAVYSCGRIGRVANPPTFSLADWFRTARRRRTDRVNAA